jgi:hypothetical protein
MSNLPAARSIAGDAVHISSARQARREIARAQAHGAYVTASEVAKVDAVADVTQAALIATAHVSGIEALLVNRVPHAEARLRHIADAGTAGMATVVMQMSRHL